MYIVLYFRYSNMDTLEKVWSNEYIERVDIVMKESVGVSGITTNYAPNDMLGNEFWHRC